MSLFDAVEKVSAPAPQGISPVVQETEDTAPTAILLLLLKLLMESNTANNERLRVEGGFIQRLQADQEAVIKQLEIDAKAVAAAGSDTGKLNAANATFQQRQIEENKLGQDIQQGTSRFISPTNDMKTQNNNMFQSLLQTYASTGPQA